MNIKISKHAKQRLTQANLSEADIRIVLKHGSFKDGNKRNRRCYSIRTEANKAALLAHLLTVHNTIASEYVKRLLELTVVISPDGWIITAYKNNLNNITTLSHQLYNKKEVL